MLRIAFVTIAAGGARACADGFVCPGESEMEVACRGNVHCRDKKNQEGGEDAHHGGTMYHAIRW